MCFEKRHLHAALEGCDKYPASKAIYPFHSKLASTRNWADGLTSINANDASMPMDQPLGQVRNPLYKMLSLSLSLSLSLPHQATPITDIDAKQRRRRKMKIEKQAAALVEKKQHQQEKKYNKNKHKKKYNNNSNNGKHSNINLQAFFSILSSSNYDFQHLA